MGQSIYIIYQGPESLSNILIKFQVSSQEFYNMASDWLVAVQPANGMPGSKIFVNNHGF